MLYIIVHETTHAAEALNSETSPQASSENHNSFAKRRYKMEEVIAELNTGLGMTTEEITIMSWIGAEESDEYKEFVKSKAKRKNITEEEYKTEYDKTKKVFLNTNWLIDLNSSKNERPKS